MVPLDPISMYNRDELDLDGTSSGANEDDFSMAVIHKVFLAMTASLCRSPHLDNGKAVV